MARTKGSLTSAAQNAAASRRPPASQASEPESSDSESTRKQRPVRSASKPAVVEPDEGLDEEEYIVEAILDERLFGSKIKYLVKWEGFGPQENSWEPEENLVDNLVFQEYMEQRSEDRDVSEADDADEADAADDELPDDGPDDDDDESEGYVDAGCSDDDDDGSDAEYVPEGRSAPKRQKVEAARRARPLTSLQQSRLERTLTGRTAAQLMNVLRALVKARPEVYFEAVGLLEAEEEAEEEANADDDADVDAEGGNGDDQQDDEAEDEDDAEEEDDGEVTEEETDNPEARAVSISADDSMAETIVATVISTAPAGATGSAAED